MRGKAQPVVQPLCILGITPAHAGKRLPSALFADCGRDHPRPCGEKVEWLVSGNGDMGSPPPMRGKAILYSLIARAYRITPAHAGKSFLSKAAQLVAKDHPRPCGEKLLLSL